MRRSNVFHIIVYVAIGVASLLILMSCSEKKGQEVSYEQVVPSDAEEYVPESPYYVPSKELKERHDSIIRELNKKIIVQSATVKHNARNASEAYDEGFDVGREDGEEDGMNNDPEFSFDDSCPYKGKMRIAYKRGYRDGYDEGLEDGLEEYNLTKESWEEETDW